MDPTTVERIFGPAFVLMGLSHLLQPQMWVRFFELVRQTGSAAVIIGLYTLPSGLLLIATHNIWRWDWSLFLTIAGWSMTLKSALYILIPGLTNRVLTKRIATTSRSFQIVGAATALIGVLITWQAWTRQ